MGKNIKLILTVLVCTGISFAQALSVGDVVVDTALNQPLKASIGLRNIGSTEASDIEVSLAKPADFEIADIEYLGFLNGLRFTVVPVGSNAAKVEIVSKRAIREPYVNFLLAIAWPNGQILKEYTILLDPVFGDTGLTTHAGSVAAQVEEAVATPRLKNHPSPQAATQSKRVSRLSRSSDTASSVTVLAEDTLWAIAKRVAPDGASVHQVMHSIKRANPGAFINNNINGLKAGYQLAIPSAPELQQITFQQAVSASRRDTALWRGSSDFTADRRLAVRTKPAGELQLAAAGDESGVVAAGEQLDALTSQNDDLLGRVGSLEEQVGDLNRLLELKNKQLALLQQQAQIAGSAEASTLDEIEEQVEGSAGNAITELARTSDESESKSGLDSASSLAATQVLKGAKPMSFEPSMEWWQQASIQLASLGGLSVLLLGVLWLRRSRDEEEFVVEDGDVILDRAEDEEDFIPLPEVADDDGTFDELESLSEQFKKQDYDTAMAGLEAKVTAEAHRADLRLLLLQKSSEADDKDRFIEHYRFLEAIAKPEDLQTAERILIASRGSADWLDTEAEAEDDFFKEIVHEAELTDEIEALLLASEGEASLDDFDFENLDDSPSLDEVSLDTALDETFISEDVSSEKDREGLGIDLAEAVDDHGLDFEETVILSPEINIADDEVELEDDSLDFDLDFTVEEPTGVAESSTILDNDLEFESTMAIDSISDSELMSLSEAATDESNDDLDDFSFDLGELEEFGSLDDADESGDIFAADEHINLDLDSDTEILLDEGLVGDRADDEDVFDIDEDDIDSVALEFEVSQGSDDVDDFEDFPGFLDDADEASIGDENEAATKLELAEAFIEMDDIGGAQEILAEVLAEGDVVQQATARELLDKVDS